MKIAPLYEVKNKLSEYVQQAASGPIVITKNGKPCAALVHLEEDQDLESFLLSHNMKFLRLLDESAERSRKSGGTSLSSLIEEVEDVPKTR